MVGWIEKIYEKMYKKIDGWLDGQKKKMDGWMDKKIYEKYMDGWKDKKITENKYGWLEG